MKKREWVGTCASMQEMDIDYMYQSGEGIK